MIQQFYSMILVLLVHGILFRKYRLSISNRGEQGGWLRWLFSLLWS